MRSWKAARNDRPLASWRAIDPLVAFTDIAFLSLKCAWADTVPSNRFYKDYLNLLKSLKSFRRSTSVSWQASPSSTSEATVTF